MNPKHKTAYYHLGNLYLVKKKREEEGAFGSNFTQGDKKDKVEVKYEKAVENDPENVEAYFNLAWASRNLHLMGNGNVVGANC